MNIEQKIERARALSTELVNIREMSDMASWLEGERLYELKKDGLYKYEYGMDEHDTSERAWSAYLREKSEPLSTAEFKIANHTKWIVELGYSKEDLRGIHVRKLHSAIPFATERAVADTLVEEAKRLPYSEFVKFLHGGEEPCWHPREHRHRATVEVDVCDDCGKEIKPKKK